MGLSAVHNARGPRMSTRKTHKSVKDLAKPQQEGCCHLNLNRTVLRDRACSPQCCVRRASLGRCPWDMGTARGSGYPRGSSSQQDSPLANSTWLLAPGSRRDRTCGQSQWVVRNEGVAALTSPGFLESKAPPDQGSFWAMEDLDRSKTLQDRLRLEELDATVDGSLLCH